MSTRGQWKAGEGEDFPQTFSPKVVSHIQPWHFERLYFKDGQSGVQGFMEEGSNIKNVTSWKKKNKTNREKEMFEEVS